MGKPYNQNSFDIYKVGDIDVYISHGLKIRNSGIKIILNKILWIESLNVDGIIVN